ncbi:481_t:CDS:2 [Ambispora gerdemannii]|uniref:481_t:CDS:1 n=1 Tax=Ambispora gerdemannii TaxID=144530 RepID=A0A9N9G472_9GLOM|nr:481_t:CDS:2 [Ambispora gerdemannii]
MGNRQSKQSKPDSKKDAYIAESEATRNERQQIVEKLIRQGNFSSLIGEQLKAGGLKILDVGCGPGTWVIEMAETYPLCSFIGVDISPVDLLRELPVNVEFIQANILDGLPIETSKFDFVVMHFLDRCFTIKQWKSIVIQEVARVMKPEALLEWMECNVTLENQGENTKKLMHAFLSAANSKGLNLWVVNVIPKILSNSGIFVNIKMEKQTVTCGSADGKCGELSIDTFINLHRAMKKQTTEFMSLTWHEYDLLLDKVRAEFKQYQITMEYCRFCAQKGKNE